MSVDFRRRLLDEDKNAVVHGVLSDSAFRVTGLMFGEILTPLKSGEIERAHADARPTLLQMSASITTMRQAAEWGMGAVSKVYRILLAKLSFNAATRGRLL